MCFDNDNGEWSAEVWQESTAVSAGLVKCEECGRCIPEGQPVHEVYAQQYEVCRCLSDDNDEEFPCDADGEPIIPEFDHTCHCETPNVGESFNYRRCEECHKFLAAVEAAELAAGCPVYEARPELYGMTEGIANNDRSDAYKYFKQATRQFPELKKSGYLKWLWRRMFW